MKCLIRRAIVTDASGACEVVRRSISELCVDDHQGDQTTIGAWIANKTGRVQGVVATRPRWWESSSSLKASDGVLQPRVFRGRRLSVAATAAMSLALCLLRSVPLGKYWRSRPLAFSFVPRCHGLRGAQKKRAGPLAAQCRYAVIERAGPSPRLGPRSVTDEADQGASRSSK